MRTPCDHSSTGGCAGSSRVRGGGRRLLRRNPPAGAAPRRLLQGFSRARTIGEGPKPRMALTDRREKETRELARALFRRAAARRPALFEPRDWIGRMIDWSLKDESLRVALFRFVD